MNDFSANLLAESNWGDLAYTIAVLVFGAIMGIAEHLKKKGAEKRQKELLEQQPPAAPPVTQAPRPTARSTPPQPAKSIPRMAPRPPRPSSPPRPVPQPTRRSRRETPPLPEITPVVVSEPLISTQKLAPTPDIPVAPLLAQRFQHALTMRNLKQFILIREILDPPLSLREVHRS